MEAHVTKQVSDYLEAKGWRKIRMQRIVAKGQGGFRATGEAGMADMLFLRYRHGTKRILWIEFKSPSDKRKCVCDNRISVGLSIPCPICRQAQWRVREIERGAAVWVVSDFDYFVAEYESVREL